VETGAATRRASEGIASTHGACALTIAMHRSFCRPISLLFFGGSSQTIFARLLNLLLFLSGLSEGSRWPVHAGEVFGCGNH